MLDHLGNSGRNFTGQGLALLTAGLVIPGQTELIWFMYCLCIYCFQFSILLFFALSITSSIVQLFIIYLFSSKSATFESFLSALSIINHVFGSDRSPRRGNFGSVCAGMCIS